MSYSETRLIHSIPVEWAFEKSVLNHKQSLERNSLTFNCRFMTQNIWLQLSKPTNFIGNYNDTEQITYKRSCFIQKMYLLLLLYAARHTIISPLKVQDLQLRLLLFTTNQILNPKN